MSKIVALGDTHGRPYWEQIDPNDYDRIIFIGDYYDSQYITTQTQIQNFRNIVKFKLENMDKVILLFGNHDFHYMKGIHEHYSGYQGSQAYNIQHTIEEAYGLGLFKMCHIEDGYLFSHAGVTKTWLENNGIPNNLETVEQDINDLFKYRPGSFHFDGFNQYGDDITQSPIWVRIPSLLKDKIDIPMVIGHTSVMKIPLDKPELTPIDALGEGMEYLVIEDGERKVMKLKASWEWELEKIK